MKQQFEKLKETVEPGIFKTFQEVEIEILAFTYLGIRVAVNDEYEGVVYKNQVYDKYRVGEKLTAYIQSVRDDGRIDITLQPNPKQHIASTADKILAYVEAHGGQCRFNDKSSPEEIKKEFQVSKMVFKKALGSLYKQGKITLNELGIEGVK